MVMFRFTCIHIGLVLHVIPFSKVSIFYSMIPSISLLFKCSTEGRMSQTGPKKCFIPQNCEKYTKQRIALMCTLDTHKVIYRWKAYIPWMSYMPIWGKKYRVCKNYIGCNIKEMSILVTILSTLRFFFWKMAR